MRKKVIQYIGSRQCVLHLWIIALLWFIVGVLPAIVAVAVYPVDPTTSLLANIVPKSPTQEWQFWIHRVAVDPLTKSIGATLVVLLMLFLAVRVFLGILRKGAVPLEVILKTEGSQEARDGFWGWETSYKDDIPENK